MRVDRLVTEYDIHLKYVQFPLHPDTPPDGLTLQQLFAGRDIDIPAAQSRLQQLMTAEGLPYGERTMTYNSRLAQELSKWSDTQPGGKAIHAALFQGYFVDGLNIALIESLVAIAERVGLDGQQAREVLQKRSMRVAVDADWQRSRDLGITSVPTFVVGNRGLVGAQPYGALEKLATDAGVEKRPDR